MLHGIHFTLKMIQKRPLRMGLTILQVAIGVAAVAVILSFVAAVLSGGTSAANNLLYLVEFGGKEVTNGQMTSRWSDAVFSPAMVEAIREKSTEFQGLSVIEDMWGGTVECQGIRYTSQEFVGVDTDFVRMMHLKMVEGSFFTRADVEHGERVLVISDVANKQLFGSESGVGKTILREHYDKTRYEWKIIGIFTLEKFAQGAYNRPLHCIVPYSAIHPSEYEVSYSRMLVMLKQGRVTEGQNELSLLFQQEYAASGRESRQEGELLFEPAYANEMEGRKQMAKIFGLFFGSFAFVALVVGSIGILSMMLVSIVERTREIGLRRALGASRLSIIGQILSESVCISLIGGIFGILLAACTVRPFVEGLLFKAFLNEFVGMRVSLSIYPVLISLASVAGIGLLAGLYPGIRASRFVPVEAIKEG